MVLQKELNVVYSREHIRLRTMMSFRRKQSSERWAKSGPKQRAERFVQAMSVKAGSPLQNTQKRNKGSCFSSFFFSSRWKDGALQGSGNYHFLKILFVLFVLASTFYSFNTRHEGETPCRNGHCSCNCK